VGAFGVDSPFGAELASLVLDVEESEEPPSLPVPEDVRLDEVVEVELEERESFR
jgi:hypothetical protein